MSALTLEQILALPYVDVEDRRRLPQAPAVYCAIIDRSAVGYVGMARESLRTRWIYHHRLTSLLARGAVTIAYLIGPDAADLAVIERATIKALTPPLNVTDVPTAIRNARPPVPQSLTPRGDIKGSMSFTREQHDWLRAVGRRRGGASVASVVRQLVQAAMDAEQAAPAEAIR